MIDSINAYKKYMSVYDSSGLHTIKDYLHIKTSVIMAESFVLNYSKESLKWYENNLTEIINFRLMDYVELVNTEEQKVA
jgi:hypothetical protein